MTLAEKKIAYRVEFSRILELLAEQIYQSPLALLRENTQNAFDAILMREALGQDFDPMIEISVDADNVTVRDNGVGMTAQEIETSYWYAGQSGKNTDAARAAGVVGTFGIGALANFGVAEWLLVESESATASERTVSSVRKAELSTDTESISVKPIAPTGSPGTLVVAHLSPSVRMPIQEARDYIHDFVEFVDIPVFFNGERISGSGHRDALPSERHAWLEFRPDMEIDGMLTGDLRLLGMASGELRVIVENIKPVTGLGRPGAIVLQQDRSAIRTQRSGFGLATVAMQSVYQWGGVVDLPFLKPTAGREALDDSSNQLLQRIVSHIDDYISPIASEHSESFANDGFLRWIVSKGQFQLCGQLTVAPRPSMQDEMLSSIVERGGVQYYSGRDEPVIQTYSSEETPLIVLSRRAPRRNCERGYLETHGVKEIDTSPRVSEELPMEGLSFAHSALAIRLTRILEEDYFLRADIRYGSITGGLPLLVTDKSDPVRICLDPRSSSVAPLLPLYSDDYNAFTPFVKDFIRSLVFPRISNLVRSSTREGAEALLRHLRSNREWFEYELDDRADLEDIFVELHAGRMSVIEATRWMTAKERSVLEVSRTGTVPLLSVVREIPDEPADGNIPDPYGPRPGIDRREEETSALILTSDVPVNGYTCFLSISDNVQNEKGGFFLQPHSTEVVWGGRKVIFVFQHHSGRFGLYYDILCPGLVGNESGGGPTVTSTILTEGRTFIPIPEELVDDFLPRANERKRLEVRGDILYLEEHVKTWDFSQ